MSGAELASPADRAALAEVLARPEFRDHPFDGSALRRLLSDLWNRLLEALGTAEAERYASLGRAVFLVAAAAAAVLAWRAVRRRRPARTGGRPRAPAAAAPVTRRAAAPVPEAAGRALARGELGAAVRLAYAAAAAALGARGLPSAGQGLTGPELAARSADPGFHDLARLHDRTVFGRLDPSQPEARAAVEVARRLARRGERRP